jgi:FMN reductase
MGSIRIVSVVASPHGSGSTAKAVAAMTAGATAAGATCQSLDLATDNIETVVAAIDEAHGVIFGSPVYRASHTALLADLLEHIERGARGETIAPLQGKAVAITLTGASDHHFLATERLRGTLASFFAAQTLSPALYLTRRDFTEDKELDETARHRAELLGRALVELAAAVSAGPTLRALTPLI